MVVAIAVATLALAAAAVATATVANAHAVATDVQEAPGFSPRPAAEADRPPPRSSRRPSASAADLREGEHKEGTAAVL